MKQEFVIRRLKSPEAEWLRLRQLLWPAQEEEHLTEMLKELREPERFAHWLALDDRGKARGLAEASLRNDFVEGASSSPVAYLEGLFVEEAFRRQGIAAALVMQVRDWGRGRGCRQLASDTELENTLSQAVHEALGFGEAGRVVCFIREL